MKKYLKRIMYYNKKYEWIFHIVLHLTVGLIPLHRFIHFDWFCVTGIEASILIALGIEGADTLAGRFELNDLLSRLAGCGLAILILNFI